MGGCLDQVGIRLSQLSTKLKLKLKLSLAILKFIGKNFDFLHTQNNNTTISQKLSSFLLRSSVPHASYSARSGHANTGKEGKPVNEIL